jgi:2-iminoacetate synthase
MIPVQAFKSVPFSEIFASLDFHRVAVEISGAEAYRHASNRSGKVVPAAHSGYSTDDARRALDAEPGRLTDEELKALLSPAADPLLEEIAVRARDITRRRFGNTIQLYAPLYLSNECRSSCTYCGFSHENRIRRKTLTEEEILREADYLYREGIRHILLLTGEDYHHTPLSYISGAASLIGDRFASIGVEVYPLKEEEYATLRNSGVDSLTVYQETYDPERYAEVHRRGVKKRMRFRLECPDRGGAAGMRRIAIGALLGLSDPAAEVYMVARHARHLMRNYWRTQISVSLPRLRFAEGFEKVPGIPDRMFVRLLSALRLYLPDAGILLSTRETPGMRDNLAGLCVTTMSAGSRTDPGGYTGESGSRQFDIEDTRSVSAIRAMLIKRGLDPVCVDWAAEMK